MHWIYYTCISKFYCRPNSWNWHVLISILFQILYKTLTYTLVGNAEVLNFFDIDESSGAVTVSEDLNNNILQQFDVST